MHTIVSPTDENIVLASNVLSLGGLVAFPTETVYGLGGNAYSDKVVAEIFRYKNRPEFSPLSVCYPSLEEASRDLIITENAGALARHFLPGPLTIVLKKKKESKISLLCSAGTDTIGLRIPSNQIALELLSKVPFPLAAPSANKSSKLSPTNANAVSESLSENEDLTILDGGSCDLGIESTIIDCSSENCSILRVGAIPPGKISRICGINVDINPNAELRKKHFYINKKIITAATSAGDCDALLAMGTPFLNSCKYVLNLSEANDLGEAAANFFRMLSELDKTDAEKICVMPIPNIGMGIAINDRLKKISQLSDF